MPTPRILGIRPVGDRAILVELPDLGTVLSLRAFLTEPPEEGQLDVVAPASTVLVTAASTAAAASIARKVRAAELSKAHMRDDAVVVIDTVYDGEDLEAAAAWAGLTPEALVAVHSRKLWTAAFGGFAPGFDYLVSTAGYPAMSRRKSPWIRVPAGTVAMAGRYSAVYPATSPDGWQLIGRSAASLWDPDREPPAFISPGNRVQFHPVRDAIAMLPRRSSTAAIPASVVVRAAELQTTVQDLGREGYAGMGVPGSGALDRAGLRRANRLGAMPPEMPCWAAWSSKPSTTRFSPHWHTSAPDHHCGYVRRTQPRRRSALCAHGRGKPHRRPARVGLSELCGLRRRARRPPGLVLAID